MQDAEERPVEIPDDGVLDILVSVCTRRHGPLIPES